MDEPKNYVCILRYSLFAGLALIGVTSVQPQGAAISARRPPQDVFISNDFQVTSATTALVWSSSGSGTTPEGHPASRLSRLWIVDLGRGPTHPAWTEQRLPSEYPDGYPWRRDYYVPSARILYLFWIDGRSLVTTRCRIRGDCTPISRVDVSHHKGMGQPASVGPVAGVSDANFWVFADDIGGLSTRPKVLGHTVDGGRSWRFFDDANPALFKDPRVLWTGFPQLLVPRSRSELWIVTFQTLPLRLVITRTMDAGVHWAKARTPVSSHHFTDCCGPFGFVGREPASQRRDGASDCVDAMVAQNKYTDQTPDEPVDLKRFCSRDDGRTWTIDSLHLPLTWTSPQAPPGLTYATDSLGWLSVADSVGHVQSWQTRDGGARWSPLPTALRQLVGDSLVISAAQRSGQSLWLIAAPPNYPPEGSNRLLYSPNLGLQWTVIQPPR